MLGGWEGTDAPRLIERHVEQDTTGANGKTSIADFFNLIFFLRRAVVIFFRILVYSIWRSVYVYIIYIHTFTVLVTDLVNREMSQLSAMPECDMGAIGTDSQPKRGPSILSPCSMQSTHYPLVV